MFLKGLEIIGFKSFAQRTELEFPGGITAVVGPNGCGKSNIVDSFRWVLGEQSIKALRGNKMEDVIFNGTAVRKPLGFAEVSLTFNNEDRRINCEYNEITVTRRLYRTGESDFFINKMPCRLKDIVNLFLDTGIGRETYSIIGQGRVDAILSHRPEERRSIFEEAAGILKYKLRKKEAERRLEETGANILRIGDIIAELKGQLVPLKEQADKAREYLGLKENLDKFVLALLFSEGTSLQKKITQLTAGIKESKADFASLSASQAREEGELTALKWNLEKLSEKINAVQREGYLLNEDKERVRSEGELIKEKIKGRQEQVQKAKAEEEELNKEIELLQSLQEKLEVDKKTLQAEIASLDSKLEEMSGNWQTLHKNSGTARLEELELLRDKQKEEAYRKEAFHRNLKLRWESLGKELAGLAANGKAVGSEKELKEKKLVSLADREQDMRQRLEKLDQEAGLLKNKLIDLKDSLAEKERGAQALRETAAALKEKYKTIKELKESYTGYYQGVKNLLAAGKSGAETVGKLHGVVADLLEVPEKYRLAVEVALGSSLQNIVAGSEEDVRKAIAFLKLKKAGRATFLPLDIIKGSLLKKEEMPRDIIGLAADLVACKPLYREVVSFLLGRVLVCPDLATAQKTARQVNHRYKIVTLAGDVIYPGGAVSGGYSKRREVNLLARGQELEQLAQEIARTEQSLNKLVREIQEATLLVDEHGKTLAAVEKDKEKAASELQELNRSAFLLKAELASFKAREEELSAREKETLAERDTLTASMRRLEIELDASMRRLKESEAEIITAKEKTAAERERLEEIKEQITDLRIKLASRKEKLEGIEEKRKDFRLDSEEKESRLAKIRAFLETTAAELVSLEKELAAAVQKGEKLAAAKDALVCALNELREQEKSWKLDIQGKEEAIRQRREKLQALKTQETQLEVQLARFETELANLKAKIREEYKLEFSEEVRSALPRLGKGELNRNIEELKEKIALLGPVNTGAIAEYERIGERIGFLESQREDLLQGKKSLAKIIDEIDQKMSSMFLESFETINNKFSQVFAKLFGGGTASLELLDSSRPLESGIEIKAKPPGKKLQSISLLSGGEKALTAISLLFALLLVKPTPFCVLDEIDSSLDDTNIEKYCSFLTELKKDIQFILITHRKQTMRTANVLYGVTMEEAGVSKIISVKLIEKAG
ncbi:MAG TPA: chromosome segregation protein SMC [Firmicutes bacterium]|nr:chromosome segregation protein SMC [Bacillota bacterium]